MGYHALRSKIILHGNAGEMGKYGVLSVLPAEIARFLYEYRDTSYTSLGLPAIPLDQSNISVHGILNLDLKPEQVQINMQNMLNMHNIHNTHNTSFIQTHRHICILYIFTC